MGVVVYGENGWVLILNSLWQVYDVVGKFVKQGAGNWGDQVYICNLFDVVCSCKCELLNQEIYFGYVSSAMCYVGNIFWCMGKKL